MAADQNPLAIAFGSHLRACRKRAKISQEELGEITALHRTEISLLERGQREPRLSTIVKLADALSVPLEELLVGIDWKSEGSDPGGFECQDLGDAPVE